MLSNKASFIIVIFCKFDGALEEDTFKGGPRGRKVGADRDTSVDLVDVEAALEPWLGLLL